MGYSIRNNAKCDGNCIINNLKYTYGCKLCNFDLCVNCFNSLYSEIHQNKNHSTQNNILSDQMTDSVKSNQINDQNAFFPGGFNLSNDYDVRQLINRIKNASFSTNMLEELTIGISSRYFTSKQAFSIVQSFLYDDDKRQAILKLYDHLCDKNNVMEMIEACIFISTKMLMF